MIKHDYTGCNQCHADPSGGGLLTEYGRAQGVVLLASRYGKVAEDEEPGRVKDFAFGIVKLPESLLLGGDYRLLAFNSVINIPNTPAITTHDFIQMQADLGGQLTIDRVRVNGTLGYDHSGAQAAAITTNGTDNLISRVHWIGVDIGQDKQFLLRAGRMNLPYGLRQIEHELFVRKSTRTDINAAQQHGISLAWNGENVRAELMAILGNFQIAPDRFRERGYTGYIEWAPNTHLALGGSSRASYVAAAPDLPGYPEMWRQSHGIFARVSPFRMLTISAEGDLLFNSTPPGDNHFGVASMLQADFEPWQGLHLIATGETYTPAATGAETWLSGWGSVAWFFLPHVDIRGDFIAQNIAPGAGAPSFRQLFYLAQIHAYL